MMPITSFWIWPVLFWYSECSRMTCPALERVALERVLAAIGECLCLCGGQEVGVDPAGAGRVEVTSPLVASGDRPRGAVVRLGAAQRRARQTRRRVVGGRKGAVVVVRVAAHDLGRDGDAVAQSRAVVGTRARVGDVHVVHVAVDRHDAPGDGGGPVHRRVGVARVHRILGVRAAVDVEPQRRRALPPCLAVLVDDLDAEVLGDVLLVHEVRDQREVRGGPVEVAVRRRQMHLAALVAGREEALAELPLEAGRTDRVGLRRIEQHEVVHHRVVVQVRDGAGGLVGVAVVHEAGHHVGDPAVLARSLGVELDLVVDLAVRGHGDRPVAMPLDDVTRPLRHRAARIRERGQHDIGVGGRGARESEDAHGEDQHAEQNSRKTQSLPHVTPPS